MVMLISLASEVNELGYLLKDIAGGDRRHRDFTLNGLTFVIREVIAGLDIYRTYTDPTTGARSAEDEAAILRAVREAKRRNPRTDPSIFDFVGETLLEPSDDHKRLQFIARFQQTTDRDGQGRRGHRLLRFQSLDLAERSGGDPTASGTRSRHSIAPAASARGTGGVVARTSTHDTKRSEDVRARINVLSELPREWRSALTAGRA
jgi:(1->4)-alpha-D-glucan 1-alpha-D-glucosylmutase